MLAEDVMSRDPWTLPPSATIAQAIGVMRQQRIHHLPITSHGRLVGIVSDRDLYGLLPDGVFAESTFLAVVDAPALDAPHDDELPRLESFQQPISAIARTEVVTVNPDTELHLVIDLLLGRRVGALPVVERDGHRLVGLVSASDVLRSVRALV